MSRSGYSDDCENLGLWRGAVASAIRGFRGQAFLQELRAALDAMPEKKLIAHDLENGGGVCALGAVGQKRNLDMTKIDPEDYVTIAKTFGISEALACEIMFLNDELFVREETRWSGVRAWVDEQIIKETTP